MRVQQLGPFADISRLTLGGGGLGQLWGETSPEEARATVHAALDAGINLIDTAPSYRLCEQVIAETFAGAIRRFAEPARPRDVIAGAQRNGVGVMGIRAVQAGALTAAIDRPLKDSH